MVGYKKRTIELCHPKLCIFQKMLFHILASKSLGFHDPLKHPLLILEIGFLGSKVQFSVLSSKTKICNIGGGKKKK